MAVVSFNFSPASAISAGCRLLVDGSPVSLGDAFEFPIGTALVLSLELVDGYELDNWNGGVWFEPDWSVEVTGDTSFVAYLSH